MFYLAVCDWMGFVEQLKHRTFGALRYTLNIFFERLVFVG